MLASSPPNNEKLEFHISCRRLVKPDIFSSVDPEVKVYSKNQADEEWILVGTTETLFDCVNPNFSNHIISQLPTAYHQQQPFKFEVINTNPDDPAQKIMGSAQTTLENLLNPKKPLLILNLKNNQMKETDSKIIIQTEKTGDSLSEVSWQWKALKLVNTDSWFGFDRANPFLRFFKKREGGDNLQVHETPAIMNNLNPTWEPFKILDHQLCGADHKRIFRVECWDWQNDQNHRFIGAAEISLQQLKMSQMEYELKHPHKKKIVGTLKITNFSLQSQYTFYDYINGGQQLKIMLGVDYTGSNKIPTDPKSLHAINPHLGYNEYQRAMYAACQALMDFDIDKIIPMYGFGGIPHYPTYNSQTVSHCFPCTGNNFQVGASGFDGILNTYQYSLQNVQLSGPTYFSPLIKEIMKFAESQKYNPPGLFTVLVILTDGEIHDMDETVNLLIESCELPLSIIVIGVGNEHFSKMETLNDWKNIKNSKGKSLSRKLVDFILFKKIDKKISPLSQKISNFIQEQLVKYHEFICKKPNPPLLMNNSNYLVDPRQSFSEPPGNLLYDFSYSNNPYQQGNMINSTHQPANENQQPPMFRGPLEVPDFSEQSNPKLSFQGANPNNQNGEFRE